MLGPSGDSLCNRKTQQMGVPENNNKGETGSTLTPIRLRKEADDREFGQFQPRVKPIQKVNGSADGGAEVHCLGVQSFLMDR